MTVGALREFVAEAELSNWATRDWVCCPVLVAREGEAEGTTMTTIHNDTNKQFLIMTKKDSHFSIHLQILRFHLHKQREMRGLEYWENVGQLIHNDSDHNMK